MNAELNEADAQFVANKIAAEVSVADITEHVKVNVPRGGKHKGKKRIPLKDIVEMMAAHVAEYKAEAKTGAYAPPAHGGGWCRPSMYTAIEDIESRVRAARQGANATTGRIASLPPDPQVAIARVKRLADEAAIARLDRERELRDLTVEAAKLRHAIQGKDFKLAAEARRQLTELNEHTIEEARVAVKEAINHEDLMQLNYRSIRGDRFPAAGKASYGSCED